MLNVDSEDEGIFTVSCAGGASANVSIGLTSAPCALACAHLTVSGLIGGHSGQEIDKGRANANLLLGRVLNAVQCKLSFRLVSAAGGLKDNAIPNAAEAFWPCGRRTFLLRVRSRRPAKRTSGRNTPQPTPV